MVVPAVKLLSATAQRLYALALLFAHKHCSAREGAGAVPASSPRASLRAALASLAAAARHSQRPHATAPPPCSSLSTRKLPPSILCELGFGERCTASRLYRPLQTSGGTNKETRDRLSLPPSGRGQHCATTEQGRTPAPAILLTPHLLVAVGSLTSVSRSDIRLIQYLDSSALGLVRRWRLIGYFPIHLLPPRNPRHPGMYPAAGACIPRHMQIHA
jgi:hypothetical protein